MTRPRAAKGLPAEDGPLPRQLALDLPHRAALGREDFLVSRSNRRAVDTIDAWPRWPHSELLLIGPQGSGKSHLAEVWRAVSGADRVSAADLDCAMVPRLAQHSALVVDDCGRAVDAPALVHLLNETSRSRAHLLLAARTAPAEWGVALPDLVSRLNRMSVARLEPPDDVLMEAVLVKLFADRQIEVGPAVVRYLALRIERSFAALHEAVARLDRLAIEERRRVTRPLAARMLSQMAGRD